jgi:hypothetical protein
VYGPRVLRCAPWPALLIGAALALALFVIAALTRTTGMCWPTTLLGLSVCGATAAYVLDEEAAAVADSSPASRSRRTAWRMLIVVLPAGIAGAGLMALNHLDPATHWLRLLPLCLGFVAAGVAIAASLRQKGMSTPGDLASVVTLATTVLVVMTNPVRRWASVAPLGDAAGVTRSAWLWCAVVVACGLVVVVCSRDPACRPGTLTGPSGVSLRPREHRAWGKNEY